MVQLVCSEDFENEQKSKTEVTVSDQKTNQNTGRVTWAELCQKLTRGWHSKEVSSTSHLPPLYTHPLASILTLYTYTRNSACVLVSFPIAGSHLCFRFPFVFKFNDFEKVDIDEAVSMCVSAYLFVCLVSLGPCKRFLGNYWSHHEQSGHGDCLRHENASHVNYIDLDLHSRSHRC